MLLASTARAATLLDPTPAENDFFGSAVTLAGGNLLVGSRFDDTAASDAGAAYLLDAATGALLTTLLDPAPPSTTRRSPMPARSTSSTPRRGRCSTRSRRRTRARATSSARPWPPATR